jgi:hypothetical protein
MIRERSRTPAREAEPVRAVSMAGICVFSLRPFLGASRPVLQCPKQATRWAAHSFGRSCYLERQFRYCAYSCFGHAGQGCRRSRTLEGERRPKGGSRLARGFPERPPAPALGPRAGRYGADAICTCRAMVQRKSTSWGVSAAAAPTLALPLASSRRQARAPSSRFRRVSAPPRSQEVSVPRCPEEAFAQ